MLSSTSIRAAVLLALASLTLAACGGTAKPPSASHSALDLAVINEREVEVDSGRIVSLSPDGRWLAVDDSPELCILAADSMDEELCVNYRDHMTSLEESTLAWSPDSTRLLFCENVTILVHDSDLWLLEIKTGELRNLTDDGYDGSLADALKGGSLMIDYAPVWSPDGRNLVFSRSELDEGKYRGTSLYVIDANGGEPEKLVTVSRDDPLVVWYGLYWSSRPERIYYSVVLRDPEDRDSGLWVVNRDGRDDRQILEVEEKEQGPPLLMGVTEGENLGLIWYFRAAGRTGLQPNVSHFALVDLETGETEVLKEAKGDEIEFVGMTNATLSPDGSKVAYVYSDLEQTSYLVVRDVAGGEENILFKADEFPLGGSIGYGLGLDWAENDTIYVWTGFESGLLLEVGVK